MSSQSLVKLGKMGVPRGTTKRHANVAHNDMAHDELEGDVEWFVRS